MRTNFKEFYRLSAEEFKKIWDECLFVFDANVLLNLYRYSQATSGEFIKILKDEKISKRVWMSHQYAFEYQKNRLLVISEQKRSYEKLTEEIEGLTKKFERHPFLKMRDVMGPSLKSIRDAKRKHPKWNEDDHIRHELTSLFENKVGKPLDKETLSEIYKEGQVRYSKKIPPGYLDNKKEDESKFGDLVGWKEIMIYAKEVNKPVIFITDENDEDWWWRVNGELVGARYELIKEINDYSGVLFCMYNSRLFHKQAAKFLKRKINQAVEKEIKEITENKGNDSTLVASSEDVDQPANVQQILAEDVGKSDTSGAVVEGNI